MAGSRPLVAQGVFYPAAALHALLALPLSVAAMSGVAALPAVLPTTLAHPWVHAQEMLYGFALAVVAGNQLGPASGARIGLLFGLWITARIAGVVAPDGLAFGLANAAFAGTLALQLAPRLFRAAKKLRNQALPLLLVTLAAAPVAFDLARRSSDARQAHTVLAASVLLFALLMAFMGGRILAPAIAGQLQRQHERLTARVQPRLEGVLLVTGAGALIALLAGFGNVSGVAAAATGALVLVRMARWRPWRLRGRPDLLCMVAGYAWLGLGLLALGAALAREAQLTAALHVLTIGALGTLTFNVMALGWRLRARRDPTSNAAVTIGGTLLLGAAAALRLLAASSADAGPWLAAAALCWSAAWALLLGLFAVERRRPVRRVTTNPATGSPSEREGGG